MTGASHPLNCITCTYPENEPTKCPAPLDDEGLADKMYDVSMICGLACHSSTTTSAGEVLEQIEKIISDRIQELKYPKSHDCVRETLLGENQALWAQIKELRAQAERERG